METTNENKERTTASASASKHSGKHVKRIVQGRFLSFDFFKRNAVYVIGVILMFLAYISNKFEYQSRMKEVMDLKEQLATAEADCVNASAKYNSMIRESRMTQYVQQKNIDLAAPQEPPYHLNSK